MADHANISNHASDNIATDILSRDVNAFLNDLGGVGVEDHGVDHSAHAHHDHGAHAGGHSGHEGHMMKMWFHGGYEEVILFDFWRTSTFWGLFLSCALIFVMGAAYEGLKWSRVHLQMKLTRKVSPLSHRRVVHLILPSLYVIQLILAYWLMLIVMTYNTYLTAAVILGAGVGHWIFAVLKPFEFDELATDACH